MGNEQADGKAERKEGIKGPMNLLTNYDETLRALIAMEGQAWLDRQREYARDYRKGVPHENDVDGVMASLQKGEGGVIYGDGGVRRYIVDGNGKVFYSEHRGPRGTEKAKSLGFEIL